MPDALKDESFIWRPVMDKILTLTEVETTASLHDILAANEMLDVRAIADAENENARNKALTGAFGK